jgi:NAD(P)-dependent dehydrogenase (short-subunit alcohol dehydrogenase family)
MTSQRLAGLSAIVTGVSGGLGGAIAERFRLEGARVVGIDVRPPEASVIDGFISADLATSEAVSRAMAEALVELDGRLDILVTAAALTGGRGRFPDVTDNEWQSYIDTNLSGTFFACRAAARAMIAGGHGGSIITLGSINSLAAEQGASAYATSKGGVALLTKAMAVDLAVHGIRANVLAPGPTEVPRNAELFRTPELAAFFAEAIPMGAVALPADVANAAVFLAEPGSRMVTDTTLVVDGGMLARIPTYSAE